MRKRLVVALILTVIAVGTWSMTSLNIKAPRTLAANTALASGRAAAFPAVSTTARTTPATRTVRAGGSGGTTLGSPAPVSGYCGVWKRRWYNSSTKKWVYTDHNTPAPNGSDTVVGGPENVVIKKGDQGHNDSRYGVNAKDFWIEALGGGGYGSSGYPYPWLGPNNANGEPTPNNSGAGETGEGGVVQGDVHPSGHSVNFSVWSFSADDETDHVYLHDTVQGACVEADGTTVSTGDVWLPTHMPHP